MKYLSPRGTKTLDEVCSLKTDNKSTLNAWIAINEETVSIYMQRNGQKSTGHVNIDKTEFNRLIEWYNRPQKTIKRFK